MFPVTVERWRHLVNLEAGRVPPDLVLSVMRRESFGRVGSIGGKDDRYGYTDSELSCGFPAAYRRRDLGLMQVAPLTLRTAQPGPLTAVALGPMDPAAQRLRRAANLARHGSNRRPPGVMLVLMLEHHPHRTLSDLR